MRTLFMVVLLMSGALVNVAIVLGLSFTKDPFIGTKRNDVGRIEWRGIDVFRVDSFGTTLVFVHNGAFVGRSDSGDNYKSLIPSLSNCLITSQAQLDEKEILEERRWLLARGWPWRTTVAEGFESWRGTRPMKLVAGTLDSIELPSRTWNLGTIYLIPQTIPTRILWRGTLLNCVFYAFLLSTPILYRQVRRALQVRCMQCGYQLLPGQSVCPECGNSSRKIAET